MDAVNQLLIKIGAKKDPSVGAALKATEKAFKDRFGKIEDYSKKVARSFGLITVGLLGIAGSMGKAAADFEYLKSQMFNISKNMDEVNSRFALLIKLAKQSGKFALKEFVTASNVMEQFKKGSTALLPAISAMAEAMGVSLQMAASNVARALEGDSRAFLTLERSLGITDAKLQEFDSSFDRAAGNARKNAEILQRYIQSTFGQGLKNTSKTAQSALGEIKLSFQELQAAIGEHLLPEFKRFASVVTKLMKNFKDLSSAERENIAGWLKFAIVTTASITVIATLIPLLIKVYGALALLGVVLKTAIIPAIGGATAAIVAFTGVMAAAVLVAGALITSTLILNQAAIDEQRHYKTTARIIRDSVKGEKAHFDALKKHRAGQKLSDTDLVNALLANQQMLRNAQKTGNTRRISEIQAERKELRSLIASLKEQLGLSGGGGDGAEPAFQSRLKEVEAGIVQKKRLLDLNQLDVAGQKRLAELLREKAAFVLQLNKNEEAHHKLIVEAKNIERGLLRDTQKAAKDSAGAKKKSEGEKLKAVKTRAKEEKNVIKDIDTVQEDSDNAALQRKKALQGVQQNIQDDIARLTMNQADYEILQFQRKIEKYREAGVEEVKIKELIEAKKADFAKKGIKAQNATTDESIKKLDDLKRKLDSMKSARAGGPGMGIQEAMLQSSIAGQQAMHQQTPSIPGSSNAGLMALGGAKKQPEPGGKTITTTVNIAGVNVEGEKAWEKAGQEINKIIAGANRTESLDDLALGGMIL